MLVPMESLRQMPLALEFSLKNFSSRISNISLLKSEEKPKSLTENSPQGYQAELLSYQALFLKHARLAPPKGSFPCSASSAADLMGSEQCCQPKRGAKPK